MSADPLETRAAAVPRRSRNPAMPAGSRTRTVPSPRRSALPLVPLNRWKARTHGQAVGAIIAAIMPNHISVERPQRDVQRRRACAPAITLPPAPTGTLVTRHSNCEKRPCDPDVRNRTTPSSYSDSPSAITWVGAWIWLKMFSNSTGLDLSRPRICVTTVFSRPTMDPRLTGPSSSNAIARNSVGCRVATNDASFSHGPPARPIRIVSSARRCASDARSSMMIVSSQPPSIMRCGVSNATTARVPASEHLAERALVDAHAQYPLQRSWVQFWLKCMWPGQTSAHEQFSKIRPRAYQEGEAVCRHRRIGLVDPRCYIRFPSCRSGLSGRSNHSTSQNLSNLRPTAWKMPTERNPNFLCSDCEAGFGRLMPATTV